MCSSTKAMRMYCTVFKMIKGFQMPMTNTLEKLTEDRGPYFNKSIIIMTGGKLPIPEFSPHLSLLDHFDC